MSVSFAAVMFYADLHPAFISLIKESVLDEIAVFDGRLLQPDDFNPLVAVFHEFHEIL